MAKNDAIKKMHIQQGDLVLADKNIGAEAQYVDVSYDKKNDIIEDINAEGVKVDKTEALSTTLKNLKGVTDKAVVWDEMNVLGSKNMMRIGPQPSGPIAGVTYTIDQKTGVIVINGSPNVEAGSKHTIDLPNAINEACYFTIDCNNLSTAGTSTTITLLDNNGNVIKWFGPGGTTDGEAEIEVPKNSNIKTLQIEVPYGSSALNLTIKPMLRLQSIKDRTYEPYAKTNQELTRDLVDFKGATDSTSGTHGLVPAPTSADLEKFLKGDGTWAEAAARLAQLKDVSIGNVNVGDQLTYVGGEWTGKGDSSVLNHNGNWSYSHDVTHIDELPYNFDSGFSVVFNNEIHILSAGGYDGRQKNHYAWNGTAWRQVSTLPYDAARGNAVVFNGELYILSGINAGSDRLYTWNGTSWRQVSTLPYYYYDGEALVYNNEIHILGGAPSGSAASKHYAWDGTSWKTISTLPYNFINGSAVVFNGEIHILGSKDNTTNHYAWNGTAWRQVSTLPYDFYDGSAVVFNGEIYILGSINSTAKKNYYAWNGTAWRQVSTLPYDFYEGSAVVFNNEIHLLGGRLEASGRKNHYAWNTSAWHQFIIYDTQNLPYDFQAGSATNYNNRLHLLGGGSSAEGTKQHYSSANGTTWTKHTDLPNTFSQGCSVVHEGKLYILGDKSGGNSKQFLAWENDTKGWQIGANLPYDFYQGCAVIYNGEIHILGGGASGNNVKHYVRRPTAQTGWVPSVDLPYAFNYGAAVVYDNKIHIMGGSSGATNHYAWNGTSWTQVSTLPYSFSHGKAVVWNNEIHIFGSATSGNGTKHYAWNGSTWKSINTLKYNFQDGDAVFFNNQLWTIGSSATLSYTGNSEKFIVDGLVNGSQPGLCPSTSSTNPRFVHSLDKSSNVSAFLRGDNTWQDIGIRSGEVKGPIDNTTGAKIVVNSGELALLICYAYNNSNSYFKQMREYILIGGNSGGKSQIIPSVIGTAGTTGGISTSFSTTGDYALTIKAYSSAYRVKYLLLKFKNFT